MALAKRRKIKELPGSTFPEREWGLEEICGRLIACDEGWQSFAEDAQALKNVDKVARHLLRKSCTSTRHAA